MEAADDRIAEKDLVTIPINSLPGECNYLITALETIAEERLSWNHDRDRMIHEYDKLQGGSEGAVNTAKPEACKDALFTMKLTEQKRVGNSNKCLCHYFKNPDALPEIALKGKLVQRVTPGM